MQRVLTVIALGFCVGVAAACGGSSLRAVAREQAKYYGDAHATITRVETVRIRGARRGHSRWAMIRMKGRTAFRVGCPRPGPGAPGPCGAHYLEVGIDLTNHEPGLAWGLTASELSAITKARRASPRFRIFPDTPALYLHCAIPEGGAHLGVAALAGTCSTVAPPNNRVRRVRFIETWSPQGGASGPQMSAGWVVSLGSQGRVRSIHVNGEPPQLWKQQLRAALARGQSRTWDERYPARSR
jgi:hypothetical protein